MSRRYDIIANVSCHLSTVAAALRRPLWVKVNKIVCKWKEEFCRYRDLWTFVWIKHDGWMDMYGIYALCYGKWHS